MALRLTGDASAAPADLRVRAQACLHRGDLAGYRGLWRDAAGIADVHRRYHARTTLTEQALGAIGQLPNARVPATLAAAATEVVSVLEETPAEPVLLNQAGVLLYELWSLDAAAALFAAARRLDPALAGVEGNLAEVARRRTVRAGAPQLPPAVGAVLPPLAKRAGEVAARARPATGLTLSLAMIVKDEEEMLPRCLAAVRAAIDELIVVDTGSSDRTVEIAESFGARVLHHAWDGDFAAARNVAFDAATGDWVMYLDADEVLVADDADALRALTGRTWREAFFLSETNFTGDLEDGTAVVHSALRVFRNRPEYRFSGRLHEQIADKLPGDLPERLEATTVRIEHYGYLGVVRDTRQKSARNTELLRRQMAEYPGEPPAFLHFNLGSELAAAGDAAGALAEFRLAWDWLRAQSDAGAYGYGPSLIARLVKALRVVGAAQEARERIAQGLTTYPGFTDLVLEQAHVAALEGDPEQALELFERCRAMGDAPGRYTAVVGAGTYLADLGAAAVHRHRGDHAAAEALLVASLREHPRFLGGVEPLVAAMLGRGAAPAEIDATLAELVPELTPTTHFLVGTPLYEAGEVAAAEEHFRAVVERQPANGAALTALAEALLSQARMDEAAAVAARVPDSDPCAPAARRSEAFARIVGGDAAGAAEPLARAPASGLPDHDRDLLAAWRALELEEPFAAGLPAAAAGLASTALEALLRIEAFDAFERALPLVERLAIGRRDQRELRAQVYLRRGYLASAADEWMAACSDGGPDAPALAGLARVAAAQGLEDDARVFATEAHTLDPAHADAARLVAALGR